MQPAAVVALSAGDTALAARAGSQCSYWQQRVTRLKAAIREVKQDLLTAHGVRRQGLKKKLDWLEGQLAGAIRNKRKYC